MPKHAMFANEISIEKISFSDKVSNNANNNGRTVYVSYPSECGFVIETPWMKTPLGMSVFPIVSDNKTPERHSLDLAFTTSDLSSPDEIECFRKFIKDMDAEFMAKFVENSSKWVKKTYDCVDDLAKFGIYTKMYRVAKDKEGNFTDKYPATFKLNLPMRDGVYSCPMVDNKGAPFTPTKANTQGATVKAIIKCVGMWLAAGKFGCTWRLMNMMVIPREDGNKFEFRTLPPPSSMQASEASKAIVNDVHVDTSDDDDDDDEIEQPPKINRK